MPKIWRSDKCDTLRCKLSRLMCLGFEELLKTPISAANKQHSDDGVMTVRFKEPEAAEKCVEASSKSLI